MNAQSSMTVPLTDKLARKIQQHIVEDGLQEGDFYLTEEQVSQQFGASRRVAREAIGQLRTLDVLRARKRKGLIVGQADPVRLFSSGLELFGRNIGNFRELAALRYTIEVGAVDLAVSHATKEQLDRLTAAAEAYRLAVDGTIDVEGSDRAEVDFHGVMLECTASSMITSMQAVLLEYMQSSPYDRMDRQEMSVSAVEHEMIAVAMQLRDRERVRALVRQHLDNTINSTSDDPNHAGS